MAKVAINGFGRIGRAIFKISLDIPELEIAAVNDIVPTDNLAYLLKYDTVYGRYEKVIESTGVFTKAEELKKHVEAGAKALMTTVHAYTSSQELVDAPSKKFRRGRAAAANFVPTSTDAAIIDLELTQVIDGDLVKVMSWYDNEWGYSNQLVREAARIPREAKDIRRD